ncbi:MAG TPA: hypothetical protein VFW09_14360 [Solirubrobacteraceae bacterium]|nr:hypothetical protein [Solirubrobacteraceae bacterium]
MALALPVATRAHVGVTTDISRGAHCPVPAPGYATCAARFVHIHPPRSRTPGSWRRFGVGAGPADSGAMAANGEPQLLLAAYDLNWLAANRGVGQTVAVVDPYYDATAEQDLAAFRSQFGMPACTGANGCFERDVVGSPGAADSDWSVETAIDLAAVSTACPQCHIDLVEAQSNSLTDLTAAENAAAHLHPQAISDSWDAPAATDPLSLLAYSYPGISVTASDGDDGYHAGLAAWPAALQSVTAVGGTTLTADPAAPRGFTETAWSAGGSGCAPALTTGLLSFAGCDGRLYSDVAADADFNTGLDVYVSGQGWLLTGGTSLASPLVAGFLALTGASAPNGNWAESNAPALNDITSGSNGSCAIPILCQASAGFDGPTGAGTISGDMVAGGPGVGSAGAITAVSATAANVAGGVYTNRLNTTAVWKFGTTPAATQSTTNISLPGGIGVDPVTASLVGLAPSTTYYYRLVATNAAGAVDGPLQSFKTAAGPGATSNPGPPAAATAKPTVVGGPSVSATPSTADIHAHVNGHGQTTTCTFALTNTATERTSTSSTVSFTGTSNVSGMFVGLHAAARYAYTFSCRNAAGRTVTPRHRFNTAPVIIRLQSWHIVKQAAHRVIVSVRVRSNDLARVRVTLVVSHGHAHHRRKLMLTVGVRHVVFAHLRAHLTYKLQATARTTAGQTRTDSLAIRLQR